MFSDQTSTGKCLVFVPEPGPIHHYPVIDFSTCSFYVLLMFVVISASGQCRDGPGSDPRLHRIHGHDHCLKPFGRRSSLLIAGMFLTAAASMARRCLFCFFPHLAALGRNATLTGRTDIWVLVIGELPNARFSNIGYSVVLARLLRQMRKYHSRSALVLRVMPTTGCWKSGSNWGSSAPVLFTVTLTPRR